MATLVSYDPATGTCGIDFEDGSDPIFGVPMIANSFAQIGYTVFVWQQGASILVWGPKADGESTALLARTKNTSGSAGFTTTETTIIGTPAGGGTVELPGQHLIKVSADWRSLASTVAGDIVELYITDENDNHLKSQNHRLGAANVGHCGGHIDVTLSVVSSAGGDPTWITPGFHSFKLRAARVAGTGTITVGAATTYPAELRVEDLGWLPASQA
jgi:hypothetical protein